MMQDGLWFVEHNTKTSRLQIKIQGILHTRQSPHQRIQIAESIEFGRMLIIDDTVMLTEFDEFIYHEMIVHVPLFAHPNPQRVIIIGGGDGGAAREVLKHDTVESVRIIDIDEEVVKVSREYLSEVSSSFESPKVEFICADGLQFIKETDERFDVMIVDSTDPVGPGVTLFTEDFYRNASYVLKNNGIMTAQIGSSLYETQKTAEIFHVISRVFDVSAPYFLSVPSYSNAPWTLSYASARIDACDESALNRRWLQQNIETRYYNPDVHKAAFAVPSYFSDYL